MTKRKIKLDGKVCDFDMSDGEDQMSFGMNGAGDFSIKIDGESITPLGIYDGYVTNKSMLDGDVNFTSKTCVFNKFNKVLTPNDERVNK